MKQNLLFSLLIVILLSSCSSIYMPSVPNTPMLTTQGEIAAGAHMSLKGNFNFNSAYAITDHVAVIANGAFMQNDATKKDIKNKSIEIALYSLVATIIQFYGYGVGFLKSFINLFLLKKKPESAHPELFFHLLFLDLRSSLKIVPVSAYVGPLQQC